MSITCTLKRHNWFWLKPIGNIRDGEENGSQKCAGIHNSPILDVLKFSPLT